MPEPLADVVYIHRPIRPDLREMKGQLAPASGSLGPITDPFAFLRRVPRIHESGEEDILFPAIDERALGTSDPYMATHTSNRALMDRLDAALAGQMSAHVPPEEMPAMTKWMLDLLSPEDRAGFVRMVQDTMPCEAFGGFSMGIKAALSADDWSDLAARVPELAG